MMFGKCHIHDQTSNSSGEKRTKWTLNKGLGLCQERVVNIYIIAVQTKKGVDKNNASQKSACLVRWFLYNNGFCFCIWKWHLVFNGFISLHPNVHFIQWGLYVIPLLWIIIHLFLSNYLYFSILFHHALFCFFLWIQFLCLFGCLINWHCCIILMWSRNCNRAFGHVKLTFLLKHLKLINDV